MRRESGGEMYFLSGSRLHIIGAFLLLRPQWRKKCHATGCSAVRLAHLLWEQGVVGSNPATPTMRESLLNA